MVSPNSTIYLLKSPLELDNNNQITFNSLEAQYNYFMGRTKINITGATFQRKDQIIRYPTDENITYDDLLMYNYCMYQNTNYGDKWFYAFIEKIEYINDGLCNIKIKTDVYQTWCFNALWRQSFIEREHLAKADDIIGANTIPEKLETGEYISFSNGFIYNNDCTIIIASTFLPDSASSGSDVSGSNAFGIYSGIKYYAMKDVASATQFINWCTSNGKADSIKYIFLIPDWIIRRSEWTEPISDFTDLSGLADETTITTTLQFPTTIAGSYVPKNKKLFTFPYSFFGISNNAGGNIIYRYEDMNVGGSSFQIKTDGTVTPSGSIKTYMQNYAETITAYDNGITGGKYPICSWVSDVYTNWLTQNGVNIGLSIVGSGVNILSGEIGTGVSGIFSTLASIYQHYLASDSVKGNTNNGDVAFTSNNNRMTYAYRSIKEEYARVIDDYFQMYGYATHRVKLPNLSNRSNWNFIKTINANIIGDIPQEDMQEYKNLFNNGITLWHTTTDFLDYSQPNN